MNIPKSNSRNPEDFIGWTSEDGNIHVVGIVGKTNQGRVIYKIICDVCSKDTELFPDGYFVSPKNNLINNGQLPCGCSKAPRWNKEQFLILARRFAKELFDVYDYVGDFKGAKTKVKCKCKVCNNMWSVKLNNIFNGRGCPICGKIKAAESRKNSESKVLGMCNALCKKMGYTPIGFREGYKNANSIFTYLCNKHGEVNVKFTSFAHGRQTMCPNCSNFGYTRQKPGLFYVVKWSNKTGNSFLKFGITNKSVHSRIKQQKMCTEYTPDILLAMSFMDGNIPFFIEKSIKSSKLFTLGVVGKEDFNDGYTETMSDKSEHMLLMFIENTVNEYIKPE